MARSAARTHAGAQALRDAWIKARSEVSQSEVQVGVGDLTQPLPYPHYFTWVNYL